MNNKKAIVIGSTGMVGTELIKLLLESKSYSEVVSLTRRTAGITHPKLNEQIVDFDKPEIWGHLVQGDVLFSSLGTTIAQAKTKDAQYKVDFSYQYKVAEIAANKGVTHYVLISSAGANAHSLTFYMRIKGQLDEAVQHLPFEVISILRPGQLTGERKQKRIAEKIAIKLMCALNKIGLLKKYKPIDAKKLGKAMIHCAGEIKSAIYTLNEVHKLG